MLGWATCAGAERKQRDVALSIVRAKLHMCAAIVVMYQWFAGLTHPGRRSGRPRSSVVSFAFELRLRSTYRHDRYLATREEETRISAGNVRSDVE